MGDISGERILIFGGSGSLGTKTIQRWIENNQIINVSRGEEKQWQLQNTIQHIQHIQHTQLQQRIGDISLLEDVEEALLESCPTIICIFACLKHIHLCEKNPQKSIAMNINGIVNVHKALLKYPHQVHTVLFVSTDKACMPITTYGCSKAIAENFLQNVSQGKTKWVGVRYGNVLNSSGSIIPYLKKYANMESDYTLTHREMTRFIMTLDQSVNLIEHAILNGQHNELIIPRIYSMRIVDLFDIFAKLYGKKVILSGLRCKEKIHEDLLSESESKMTYPVGKYFHVSTENKNSDPSVLPFDSSQSLVDIHILEEYLRDRGYI
jgi:UDP-glucose 4-epimerase